MAVFSGKDGSMKWEGGSVARVRNWSVQSTLDTLETTDLGDDSREYVPGLKSATGSATIFYHDDDNSLRTLLNNCINTGTPASALLDLNWGTKRLEFRAYVTSASITCSTGEVMSAEVNFTMTGNYTVVTL
jgi:hypothetical protein